MSLSVKMLRFTPYILNLLVDFMSYQHGIYSFYVILVFLGTWDHRMLPTMCKKVHRTMKLVTSYTMHRILHTLCSKCASRRKRNFYVRIRVFGSLFKGGLRETLKNIFGHLGYQSWGFSASRKGEITKRRSGFHLLSEFFSSN